MSLIKREIESNEEALLGKLLRFYKENDQHLKDLAAISGQKTIISLRELDFLITKYSKKHKIRYVLPNGEQFNLNLDYKSQLRGHSKKRFDPFCRLGDKKDNSRLGRFFIDFETKTPIFLGVEEVEDYKKMENGVVTNVGQMNFFRWAINNKVIEYCFQNKEAIVEEMDIEYKAKKEIKKLNEKSTEKSIEKSTEKVIEEKVKKIVVQFP